MRKRTGMALVAALIAGGIVAGFHHSGEITNGTLTASVAPVLKPSEVVVGKPLSVSATGTWSESPTRFSYQWEKCVFTASCQVILGATASTYSPKAQDAGYGLRVRITAHRGTKAGAARTPVTVGTEPAYTTLDPESSSWRTNIEAVPADTESSSYSPRFEELEGGSTATVNEEAFTTNFYWLPPGAPTRKLKVASAAHQQPFFEAVPVPPFAIAPTGTDKEVTFIQPSTKREWDCYEFKWSGGTTGSGEPQCQVGGYIENTSLFTGHFEDKNGLPKGIEGEAEQWHWGVRTGHESLVEGIVTMEDLRRKEINHAIAFSSAVRYRRFFAPQSLTDCNSPAQLETATCKETAGWIVEGSRFRLKSSYNCKFTNGVSGTATSPIAEMICLAARKYGMISSDTGGSTAIFFQGTLPLGVDVYNTKAGPWEPTNGWREAKTGTTILHEIKWAGNVELDKAVLYCGEKLHPFSSEGTEAATKREGETGCVRPQL
jgi:hypothetical protein